MSASANAGTTVISNSSDHSTLAHEIGHILFDPGWHKKETVMGERPRPNEIDEGQCKRIYRNAEPFARPRCEGKESFSV